MPKNFSQEPQVTDVQNNDVYPLMRAGGNKYILGSDFMTVLTGLVNQALVGKLTINTAITGLTGGGASNLDGQATLTTAYGMYMVFSINDQLNVWQFQNAAAGTNDVTPVDNSGKRWRRQL